MSAPAVAAPRRFDQNAQEMGQALRQIADKAGVNILFDPRIVQGMRAPAVVNATTVDEALRQVLAGTGLIADRPEPNVVLITRASSAYAVRSEPAIPDILVLGRRSANVDIPRSRDDIQPYRVVRSQEIDQSGDQTIDGFLKERLTENAIALSPVQAATVNNASVVSQIDLRGLGTDNTLVLVDGHRLPSVPTAQAFAQPNINGIPLDAIDHIESISSTAGGIYGPGATGGVVNIVLKHDASENRVTLSRGISAQGDAPNWRASAHLGFQSAGGATQLTLDYEHVAADGLDFGDRAQVAQAEALRLSANTPLSVLPPISGAVNIKDIFHSTLVLSPALGGTSLHSDHTWIPLADIGGPNMAQILLANAGTYDTDLSPDGNGARQSLLTSMTTDGFLFTARQVVGPGVTARLDVLGYRALGTATGSMMAEDKYGAPTSTPNAPFTDYTNFTYPALSQLAYLRNETRTLRATASLLVQLPLSWEADADFSYGYSDQRARYPASNYPAPYIAPLPNPFADPAGFESALAAWRNTYVLQDASDRLLDANLRLAGPLFRLPGGTATMTVLGELRAERNPGTTYLASESDQQYRVPADFPQQTQNVHSLYAEMRLPMLPHDTPVFPLRGLELQLTARRDWSQLALPVRILDPTLAPVNNPDPAGTTTVRARDRTLAFTAGLRVQPLRWLTVRASYATGFLPPSAAQLIPAEFEMTYAFQPDPKRGNQLVGSEAPYLINSGGSPNLEPEFARTFSVGAIVHPKRMRLSVDYSRLSRSRQIVQLPTNQLGIGYLETHLPQYVTRAPLTAADKAAGYTGGVITEFNEGLLNIGRSTLQAVDADVSYDLPTAIGHFILSGHGTWIPSYREQPADFLPYYQLAGHADGPIKLKYNLGIDWVGKRFSLGANAQFYGGYDLTNGDRGEGYVVRDDYYRVIQQGGSAIGPQAYVDFHVGTSIRPPHASRDISVQLVVKNLFDKKPPIFIPAVASDIDSVNTTGIGYSYYGSIVGRSLELTASTNF